MTGNSNLEADRFIVLCVSLESVFGSQIASSFKSRCIAEEFDMDAIQAEFEGEFEDNGIIDELRESLGTQAQGRAFYREIRYLTNIEPRPTESNSNNNNNNNNNDAIPNNSVFVSVDAVNWDYQASKQEIANAAANMDLQCFDAFASFPESALMELIAIGEHSDVDEIFLVLSDIYNKRRIECIDSNVPLQIAEFVQQSAWIQAQSYKVRNLIALSLQAFNTRILPSFKFKGGGHKVADDINAYIEYTLLVSQLISAEFKNVSKSSDLLCPLQVDLLIITNGSTMGGLDDYIDDGGSEDDSDPEDENSQTMSASLAHSHSQPCVYLPPANAMTSWLKQYNGSFGANNDQNNNNNNNDNANKKILFAKTQKVNLRANPVVTTFRAIKEMTFADASIFKPVHRTRLTILVDRRGEGDTDTITCYRTPAKFSAMPAHFSFVNCISATGECLFPDLRKKFTQRGLERFQGGKFDAKGRLFTLSFECAAEDNVRIQWFYNGGGTRFYPHYMYTVWPKCFAERAMRRHPIDRQYSDNDYAAIKERFTLNCTDARLDHWYQRIR